MTSLDSSQIWLESCQNWQYSCTFDLTQFMSILESSQFIWLEKYGWHFD